MCVCCVYVCVRVWVNLYFCAFLYKEVKYHVYTCGCVCISLCVCVCVCVCVRVRV